jgi:Phosphatidate cytidylyltransferase, mitochondrial
MLCAQAYACACVHHSRVCMFHVEWPVLVPGKQWCSGVPSVDVKLVLWRTAGWCGLGTCDDCWHPFPAGDVRMTVAEDTNKVSRIVSGSEEGLRLMYSPVCLMQEFGSAHLHADSPTGERMQRCTSRTARHALVQHLPSVCTSADCVWQSFPRAPPHLHVAWYLV